jgi:tetratricopeptide (TPR) repeat protein
MAKSAGLQDAAAMPTTTIRLQAAVSNAPYLTRLRAVAADEMYRHYLDERGSHANSTAFILDVADLMFERGQPVLATRVLSNLAEMDLENRQVLRILGQRLLQANRADLAVPVFRQVLALAPDEPQSQRDLGLALAAAKQPQAAVDALYEVARRQWPRFPEIELIALAEMNAIIATSAEPLNTARIDPRLLKNLPLDLRATLSWDTDNSDIDLWVTDPNGERAYYGNPLSYQGGRMSHDITGGYGPEEFSLKRAKPGKYVVQAQFYGHNQQIVSGATTIQLALSTGFGTPQQRQQGVTLRLKDRKDQVFVGEFIVD